MLAFAEYVVQSQWGKGGMTDRGALTHGRSHDYLKPFIQASTMPAVGNGSLEALDLLRGSLRTHCGVVSCSVAYKSKGCRHCQSDNIKTIAVKSAVRGPGAGE